jgi:hypothetical protein
VIGARIVVPDRNAIRRGGPLRTQARWLTFVATTPPAIEPVAPCQPAVAVRSPGAQVGVPEGMTTGVGDGTGVGVASSHGIGVAVGWALGWALGGAPDALTVADPDGPPEVPQAHTTSANAAVARNVLGRTATLLWKRHR